jgi:hypothetical protein
MAGGAIILIKTLPFFNVAIAQTRIFKLIPDSTSPDQSRKGTFRK